MNKRLINTGRLVAMALILALLLLVVSLLFFLPVLFEYFATGLVPRFPTLIACCFSLLVGILCLFCGFLFSTLRRKDKDDFERSLVLAEHIFRSSK